MKTQRMIFGTAAMAALTAALFLSAPNAGAQAAAQPPPTLAAEPAYASGVTEVMKLIKGGVPTDIVLNYIGSSTLTFYLSADNIIALQQQGVPKEVLTALLKRQGETQRPMAMAPPPGAPGVPTPQPPPPAYYNAPPENPADNFNNALQARAAAQTYAYVAPEPSYPVYYPDYYDSYPYYPYSYGYWPPVYLGVGFGRFGGGFGHGGFAGHGFAVGHGGGGFSGGHAGGGHGGGHR